MRKTPIFSLLLILLFVSCNSSDDSPNEPDSTAIDSLQLVLDSLDHQPDTVVEEVLKPFGPPKDLKMIEGAIHFYVLGDFGRRGKHNQRELGLMMDTISTVLPPDFIVVTGDNFYSDGVSSIHDDHWQETFEDIYPTRNGLDCPWYVVLGNHDYILNPDAQIEYSEISERWTMPAYYFTQDFEKNGVSLRFHFMDTNPFIDPYYSQGKFKGKVVLQDTAQELRAMDSVLATGAFDWKIVVGHHPVYSGQSRGGELKSMQQHIMPHLIHNEVDVYFAGHEHVVRHLKKAGPTHYITSGAGSKTVTANDIPDSRFVTDHTAFVLASANTDSIYVQVINYQGAIEYTATIK